MKQLSTNQKTYFGETNAARLPANPKPTGEPKKPRGLGRDAFKLWDEIVPQLYRLGLATELDTAALADLCSWFQLLQNIDEQLGKAADFTTAQTARLLSARCKASGAFSRLCKQFGMTPDSRSGLDTAPPKSQPAQNFFTHTKGAE